MKLVTLIGTAILGLTMMTIDTEASEAAGRAPKITRTQVRQHQRINQGVRSGELTREEAKGLRSEQRGIRKQRQEAKRDDGVIDREERKELRQDQRDASKNIYEEKHD